MRYQPSTRAISRSRLSLRMATRTRSDGFISAHFLDARVHFRHQRLVVDPPLRVLLRIQLLDRLTLLLDPGIVFQVVPLAAHIGGAVLDPVGGGAVEDGL